MIIRLNKSNAIRVQHKQNQNKINKTKDNMNSGSQKNPFDTMTSRQ
jgi:hypothetical protein